MPNDLMSSLKKRDMAGLDYDAQGRATRREEGSATLAELQKSNPRLASRAKLAELAASRLDALLGHPLQLLRATNWPSNEKKKKRRRSFFRIAPETTTERIVVTVRHKNVEESYALRLTTCGRALALRVAWKYDMDTKKRTGPKLMPERNPRWPLLLTASVIKAREQQYIIPFLFILLALVAIARTLFRRRRRRPRPHPRSE